MILNGGDDVLRLLSFLFMFLPLSERFSVDSVLARPTAKVFLSDGKRTTVAGYWPAAFLLQWSLIYLFGALTKTGPAWADWTATNLALRDWSVRTPLAAVLVGWPRLCAILSYVVWHTEFFVGLFVLTSSSCSDPRSPPPTGSSCLSYAPRFCGGLPDWLLSPLSARLCCWYFTFIFLGPLGPSAPVHAAGKCLFELLRSSSRSTVRLP